MKTIRIPANHTLFLFCPAAIEPCHQRPTDVVPNTEDGTRNRSHRISGEMKGGKRTGETGVLHSYLDADSHTFFVFQL